MAWTTERWTRIEALFHEAAARAPDAREAFLAAQCGGDKELRAAVNGLLAADGPAADDLIEQGAMGVLRGRDPLLGARLGAFELVERIADGGMGSVYRARRTGADFEQEVAVKVLRLGLSTAAMRERFARERRTLARLVHHNVARLLDGGTTADGVPFIAMELVDGEPIDRFCDARHLPVRERLELFAAVCRAVQFAHQNLVVHLDLKPNNILVDREGVPKLLDFGVAGLLGDIAEGAGEVAGDALAAADARVCEPRAAARRAGQHGRRRLRARRRALRAVDRHAAVPPRRQRPRAAAHRVRHGCRAPERDVHARSRDRRGARGAARAVPRLAPARARARPARRPRPHRRDGDAQGADAPLRLLSGDGRGRRALPARLPGRRARAESRVPRREVRAAQRARSRRGPR